ncbi:EipA family protein [Skermanella stibiiresistens]|uniref:EipA family protein n=1 Tax=Skermanella stibiiresistens TaxID=913326 RepID=UPI0018DE69F2|nr:EipA family protein [Skermanella stibiiresistens]
MTRYSVIAALACSIIAAPMVTIIGVPTVAAQQQQVKPDGTIDFSGASAAVGVGYTWGSGTLHYKGKDYPFSASGLTLADIGGGTNVVTGEVYKLSDVNDFGGTYSVAQSGAALVGGGGIGYLENSKGVIVKVTSNSKGARLNLGIGGVEVAMK